MYKEKAFTAIGGFFVIFKYRRSRHLLRFARDHIVAERAADFARQYSSLKSPV